MKNRMNIDPKSILKTMMILTFSSSFGFAQSISPQSINSSGTSMSQSNGSLSFTVGELVVLSLTDTEGNTLGGGFTSGATISTASIQEPDGAVLNVKVYPNPTTDLITVAIQETKLSYVEIEITDMNGKVISSEKYTGIAKNVGINSSSWNIGTYFLKLKGENAEVLGIYKIVKQ
jgi:hypothetical protein